MCRGKVKKKKGKVKSEISLRLIDRNGKFQKLIRRIYETIRGSNRSD